jgi:hypothetical protein
VLEADHYQNDRIISLADPFLGSGAGLISAEKLGRKCRDRDRPALL